MWGRRTLGGLCVSVIVALCMPLFAAAPSNSPVADAAMQGDRETVRSLLKQGVDVNAAQGDGMTALHWAATKDDVEMAQMLIYAGANVKATTRLGAYTPLFMASESGNAAMIETLLNAGADPKVRTKTGMTPLMLAAVSGSADAVTILLDHGVDVNAAEAAMGETALMLAAAFGRVAAINLLLERGADTGMATTVVDVVAREKAAGEARRRREREREEREEREREEAARAEAAARAAAGQGAQPEAQDARARQGERSARASGGQGSASAADGANASSGKRNIFARFFSWIIPGGSDPEEQAAGPQPLTYGQLVGVQGGVTALHFAAREGHIEAARALLEAGAAVNEVAGDKTSPLLMATINGHFDLAMFLLDRGADPELASDAGATPLYGAVNVQWAPTAFYPQPSTAQEKVTYLELMTALLEHGADPNVRLEKKLWYTGYNFDQSGVNEQGATPFWRAAQASDVDAMRLLVAAGADPTIPTLVVPRRRRQNQDEEYDYPEPPRPVGAPAVTPLQVATGAGNDSNYHRNAPGGWLAAVTYLVEELGADVNAADDRGNTPLHNAAYRGDNDMIRYLVEQGADLTAVDRRGRNVSDWANGPIQRLQPFTETLALLQKLGAPKHNNKCVSC